MIIPNKTKIHLFQELSLNQWRWLWSAYWRLWLVLARIKFKQRFNNINWLKGKTIIADDVAGNDSSDFLMAGKMHESIRLAARLHVTQVDCLPKSIVLTDMLRARCLSAVTVIGVSKTNQVLNSHAWVELGGVIIGESESIKQTFNTVKF